jgi:Ulp1 family protease
MQLQRFLNEFSFYENEGVYTTLKQDPKFILRRSTYNSCPQQSNGYDCSLFGFATLLHIAHGIKVDETIVNQANITELRGSLYTILSSDIRQDPKKFLSKIFIRLFFPLLGYKDVDGEIDTHIQFYKYTKHALFSI